MKSVKPIMQRTYSLGEEVANAVTHGIGAALSIAGLTILVLLASQNGDAWRIISFSVYGTSLFLLYLSSTLYHSFSNPSLKRLFKILDHSAIYVLIAGTYTPFLLVSVRGSLGWSMFIIIWMLAIAGVIFKAIFIGKWRRLSTILYIGMGWIAVIILPDMIAMMPIGGVIWLLVGGLFYTGGVGFYIWHRLPYHHAVWHLCVLGGSLSHFFAILLYVLPVS